MEFQPSQQTVNLQFQTALTVLDEAVGGLYRAMAEPEELLGEFRTHLEELREVAAAIKNEALDRITALEKKIEVLELELQMAPQQAKKRD